MKLNVHVMWARARFDKNVAQKLNTIVYYLNFDLDLLMDNVTL